MTIKVTVTDKDAIYVNDHRITDRGTKWDIHHIIDEFECMTESDVKTICLKRGHIDAVKRIDIPGYVK